MLMQTSRLVAESKNLFIRRLCPADCALLTDLLERVQVEEGTDLLARGAAPPALFFPEDVVVAIEIGSGAKRVETAVVGQEGFVGWSALAGGPAVPHDAIVRMRSGTALRISAADFIGACADSDTLMISLLRFVETMVVQMGHAIASHLHDSVERRVCRWLLMRHDRTVGDHLFTKHDGISASLGIRRASVTDCLHVLEGDHLVKCVRGKIVIRDRAGLEARAGTSYGIAEAHYRGLLGPFGRSGVLLR